MKGAVAAVVGGATGDGAGTPSPAGPVGQGPPESAGDSARAPSSLCAGRVGRAHGLDGSFYVTGARARLLALGAELSLGGRVVVRIARRAGTDARPIVRLEGMENRSAAERIRGQELTVARANAPELGEGEWWAADLEGCEVLDGARHVGRVARLVELPSCEALEVSLAERGGSLLVPMVRDAIRGVDVAARRIDVDMSFLEGA